MRALYDISVLLALSDVRHVAHPAAKRWRIAHSADGWASCPLTQNGFLRIVSQKSYVNPIPLPDAIAFLDTLVRRPDHAFWPDTLSLLDTPRIDRGRVLSHRHLTDIYLLALAVKHGGRLVTLDAKLSIKAVVGATPENLVSL